MPEYCAPAVRLGFEVGSKGDAGSQETRPTHVACLTGQMSHYTIGLFRHLIDCEEEDER
jgi:hypothetical protein